MTTDTRVELDAALARVAELEAQLVSDHRAHLDLVEKHSRLQEVLEGRDRRSDVDDPSVQRFWAKPNGQVELVCLIVCSVHSVYDRYHRASLADARDLFNTRGEAERRIMQRSVEAMFIEADKLHEEAVTAQKEFDALQARLGDLNIRRAAAFEAAAAAKRRLEGSGA